MIYCLGLAKELEDIRQNLVEQYPFHLFDNIPSIDNLNDAELFLIGPSVENPVRHVQEIVAKDQLLSIVIFSLTDRYSQIKQSLQFSMGVGKNTSCVIFNPSTNYSSVFQNGMVRTRQKRSFSEFNLGSEKKLSNLTSSAVKLATLGHILEHAPIGAILINKDFIIIGANKSSRIMFSQLNDSQLPLVSVFSGKYTDLIKQIKTAEAISVQDLQGNFYEITSSSVPDEGLENTILLISDITEKKEKDRRVGAILQSLPHIAWTAGPDGKIDYYNQGWNSYTNKEMSEGLGEGWSSIIHPDDLALVTERWHASIRESRIFQQASRFKRFDGEYRWHLTRGIPIFSKNRKVDMWVGTSTDIHDQIVLNEELEKKVKDRTRLLEETNAELEQFAHISSHDLQEPLRKIQTFAHIVKDEGADLFSENIKRYIEKIISTSSRMSRLLKDLLNFTKINQQETEETIDLTVIINQIKEDLELVVVQNGASIYAENLPLIKARPLQIKQLFYNIINNSLKYRKSDVAPMVSITCQKFEKENKLNFKNLSENDYWEIIVRDNGIGFDQTYADQIFTVFQRLHTRSSYEGTGIGLAIAKKVVTNHGGEIFAISSAGEGAEFHVILPILS